MKERARSFHKNVGHRPRTEEPKVLCPICGVVPAQSLVAHAEAMNDPDHLALLVMES